MLADPQLHAVIITMPDKLHTEHCLLALQAGKAILVEKPLCTSVDSGLEILNLMQRKNISLAVAYHLRWHDGLRKLAYRLHANECGTIQHMRLHWAVNFAHCSKWRVNKELSEWLCMTVLGTHLIDIIRWMLVPICGEIKSVKSFVKTAEHYPEFEEAVLGILQFESGTTVEMFCSLGFDSPFRLEIYGSKNTIIGTDLTGKQRKIVMGNHELDFEINIPYINQLEDFIQTVRFEKKPEVSLEEGLKNIETIKWIMGIAVN